MLRVAATWPASWWPPCRRGARADTPGAPRRAADCPRNINCIPGFKRVYGMDPTPVFVPLQVADAGVQALDDGVAEVAVAFSSNPQLSRPGHRRAARRPAHDHAPTTSCRSSRASLLRRYGAPLRRRLERRLAAALDARAARAQPAGDRRAAAGGGRRRVRRRQRARRPRAPARRGPRIVVGFQAFDENQTLALPLRRGAARRGLPRPRARAGGLRPETVAAFRHGRIDMWPGYSGSLLGYLGGRRCGARSRASARSRSRSRRPRTATGSR